MGSSLLPQLYIRDLIREKLSPVRNPYIADPENLNWRLGKIMST